MSLFHIGTHISNLYEAIPGDFVQFWRTNKSGYSVIFLEWEKNANEIVGIKYWSR